MSFDFQKVPLEPPREKETLLRNVKRRRRYGQITVLRSLASSQPQNTSEADIFQHTRQMGDASGAPHSMKRQVKQGQHNAHVLSYDSYKQATDHRRDGTFRFLWGMQK